MSQDQTYKTYVKYLMGKPTVPDYTPPSGGRSMGRTRIDPSGMPGLQEAMMELVRQGKMGIEEYMQRMRPKPRMGPNGIMPGQYVSPYQRHLANTTPPNYAQNIPGYNPDPNVKADSFSRHAWEKAMQIAQVTGQLGRGNYGTTAYGAGPNSQF